MKKRMEKLDENRLKWMTKINERDWKKWVKD